MQAQSKQEARYEERDWKSRKKQEPKVEVQVDTEGIIAQIKKAIKKAFS